MIKQISKNISTNEILHVTKTLPPITLKNINELGKMSEINEAWAQSIS